MAETVTKLIRVYGIVQGVGFRPTVSRHAMETGVRGTVCNKGPYVEIFAQGEPAAVSAFLSALETRPPRRAAILKLDVKDALDPPGYPDFSIIESEKTKGEIFISPDIAICEDCKRELYDPADRRYLHPFINCTCCGPRLTILDALPYDRERTSMKAFPMCPACASEYGDPATRRYDAQPVCCNDCGPEVYLLGTELRGREAITRTRKLIASGGIVAIKGIGGFHLCCDATNPRAVALLRQRKRRPTKPFAVMVRDLDTARRECRVDPAATDVLTGHQKPILLLQKRPEGRICAETAPGNPKLGLMLPYAPVQLLLFDYDDGVQMPDCLVMTSGNESGAPICRDDQEARQELGGLCEAILSHDRMIRIRADDSVMDLFEGRPYMIRRSRGYAPLPYLLSAGLKTRVLAVGGELKNAFCLGSGDLFYPSPYVGDLEDLRTLDALKETIARFQTLLEFQPQVAACDLHPGYISSQVGQELGLPLVRVQHHYAHIVSCMAENDFAEPVLGLSFDGTGYGADGTIWGGELLLADYHGFTRLGHIAPFPQAGGDLAAKEGWRVAVTMLEAVFGSREAALDLARRLDLCSADQAKAVLIMASRRINTVTSTSAGRLFDAVSAALGLCRNSTFEGEAATALQFAAQACPPALRPSRVFSDSDEPLSGERPFVLATNRLFGDIVSRRLAQEDPRVLAYRFHLGLAELAAGACARGRKETGVKTAALSGGVFQNLLLLELTKARLEDLGFRVLIHSLIPPNDGGLALGQAVAASQQWMDQHS